MPSASAFERLLERCIDAPRPSGLHHEGCVRTTPLLAWTVVGVLRTRGAGGDAGQVRTPVDRVGPAGTPGRAAPASVCPERGTEGRVHPADAGQPPGSRARRRPLTVSEQEAWAELVRLGGTLDDMFTADALRRVYRRLARRYHPDVHPECDARQRVAWSRLFARLRAAYETLAVVPDPVGSSRPLSGAVDVSVDRAG